MRMIKEGKLEKSDPEMMFECSHCKCKFAANQSECGKHYHMNELYYEYTCPCCGGKIYSQVQADGVWII